MIQKLIRLMPCAHNSCIIVLGRMPLAESRECL